MGKFFFWLVWVVELIVLVIGGGLVMLFIGFEGALGYTLLFFACGVVMIIGLTKALSGYKAQAEPSKLTGYLALPLIAAFIGFGACFTALA